MQVSDYIVKFLIDHEITDVFGYPGGMVTYLMESFDRHHNKIHAHLCYHEQGAAFAACGYAQIAGAPGVAYATSGPGATNLITGIANAFFDSIPCIFITGQVNVNDLKTIPGMRQNGFQEMDIVSLVRPITKYVVQITDAARIPFELKRAYAEAMSGRKGPVLLDIPLNVQRIEIEIDELSGYEDTMHSITDKEYSTIADCIIRRLQDAKRPVLIVGAGIRQSGAVSELRVLTEKLQIPVLSSMISVDVIPSAARYSFGFIGAYGHRWANHIVFKSDLILALGTRMDIRQTGSGRQAFAPQADMIRVDIDDAELQWTRGEADTNICCDVNRLIQKLNQRLQNTQNDHEEWLAVCSKIRELLRNMDREKENQEIKEISRLLPANAIVTTDVGQNQVWVAQSFDVKDQKILFSGGLAAMGYSLPAAIGAYYASREKVFCFVGDGGLQMNIQELETVARDHLPIKIFLMNNFSLGMIRHFQEMYFQGNYMQTVSNHGYSVPDFSRIAEAYGIKAVEIHDINPSMKEDLESEEPVLFNVLCRQKTYVYPKLAVNYPLYDQDPLIDRELLTEIQEL